MAPVPTARIVGIVGRAADEERSHSEIPGGRSLADLLDLRDAGPCGILLIVIHLGLGLGDSGLVIGGNRAGIRRHPRLIGRRGAVRLVEPAVAIGFIGGRHRRHHIDPDEATGSDLDPGGGERLDLGSLGPPCPRAP